MVSLRRSAPPRTGSAPRPAAAAKPSRRERAKQVGTAFSATRKADPRMPLYVGGALVLPVVVAVLVGTLVGGLRYWLPLGIVVGVLGATTLFGQRVQRTAFSQVEGQLGAAAAVVTNMRGDWRVTPAVGFTREQDLVHRVLGRPGVVLVAEGSPSRTRQLIVNEKKKLSRFIGSTPVYDVTVGDGEGQLTLAALQKHFLKLPRNISPKEVNVLDRKLKAMAPALPVPKGPMPTRVPRGKVR